MYLLEGWPLGRSFWEGESRPKLCEQRLGSYVSIDFGAPTAEPGPVLNVTKYRRWGSIRPGRDREKSKPYWSLCSRPSSVTSCEISACYTHPQETMNTPFPLLLIKTSNHKNSNSCYLPSIC